MRLGAEDAPPSLKEAQQAFRKRYVEEALRRCNGNVQEAADLVGVHRNMIARILKCTE
jgi:DNA-binding NtrC family response regulator